MEQQFVTATTLIDDESERPTIPSLRPRQRPKIRRKSDAPPALPRAVVPPRFDPHAERFFSSAETVPELLPDARFLASLALLDLEDDETTAWWTEQRRNRNVRLVALLFTAGVALLFAVALR